MKRNGFTLIELLAVIVILAIIALIASPIIIRLIEDARKEAFKDTGYAIVKAGKFLFSKDLLSGTDGEVTFTYTDGLETSSIEGKTLKYSGNKPEKGKVKINKEGELAIALHNGKYCIEKGYNNSEVTISNKTTEECKLFECGADLVDSRDGSTYKTVKIGNQCWMAENLNYDCSLEGYTKVKSYENWSGENNCAEQSTEHTGLFYQFPVIMDGSTTEGAQGLCPDGWHIPTDSEWTALMTFVGTGPATKLKALTPAWDGTDNYGFNALPIGVRVSSGNVFDTGVIGVWWTSSFHEFNNGSYFWSYEFYSDNSEFIRFDSGTDSGNTVRCLFG